MRITSKGQVTIPKAIRDKAGLLPDTEVDFIWERGKVILRRHEQGARHGDRLVAHLRGKGTGGMTTDEIMALTRGEA